MIQDKDEDIKFDEDDEYEAKVQVARSGDIRFRNEACQNGEVIDTSGEDLGTYNFQVQYTLPPLAFKNEVVVPDDWGKMDNEEDPKTETSNNEVNSKKEIDEEEQKQEDIRKETNDSFVKQMNKAKLLICWVRIVADTTSMSNILLLHGP